MNLKKINFLMILYILTAFFNILTTLNVDFLSLRLTSPQEGNRREGDKGDLPKMRCNVGDGKIVINTSLCYRE